MFARYITTGVAGAALMASVAFAQTPTATSDRANTAPSAASDASFKGDWRASKVVVQLPVTVAAAHSRATQPNADREAA